MVQREYTYLQKPHNRDGKLLCLTVSPSQSAHGGRRIIVISLELPTRLPFGTARGHNLCTPAAWAAFLPKETSDTYEQMCVSHKWQRKWDGAKKNQTIR